jgi:hypothetical protein
MGILSPRRRGELEGGEMRSFCRFTRVCVAYECQGVEAKSRIFNVASATFEASTEDSTDLACKRVSCYSLSP